MDSKEFVDAQMQFNDKVYNSINFLDKEIAELKKKIKDLEGMTLIKSQHLPKR